MKRRFFLRGGAFVAICLAVFGSDCALAAASDPYADIHTVCVLSQIGSVLTIKTVGSTVFGNKEDQSLPIEDWKLDDLVESEIADALSGRFAVSRADAPLRSASNIRDYVGNLPAAQKADAYIVVGEGTAQAFESNQTITGLTLYRHNLILGGHNDFVYAPYVIAVMDGKTGRILDHGRASLNDGGFLTSALPFAANDEANWAETPEQFTETQRQNIRLEITQLVHTALIHALRNADLVPPK